MLLYARRDYGNGIGKFTLGEQTKYGDIRTNRFSRNNTDLGKHYETVVDRVVLAQKLHVSLVDLEKSLKPKNKQQLIDAYVNSYFGPLTKEDVGPQ